MGARTAAPGSFRDNAGFVFFSQGQPFRCVNASYREDFKALKSSGLLEELQNDTLLVRHEETQFDPEEFPSAIAVLRPERIEMVSYPYEWSFGQLREAALCTLEIQRRALLRGMSLKDASAYNVQFLRGRPIHIDTLSFERYVDGEPWVAYRQFCQHFFAPLALMANVDPDLAKLLRSNIDGIPVDLASKLLPRRTRFNFGLALHIHAHARSANTTTTAQRRGKVSKLAQFGLIDSLRRSIERFEWRQGTLWGDYYEHTNYSEEAMESKRSLVREALAALQPKVVWDIGANTGEFSKIAAETAGIVVAWDLDAGAVNQHYAAIRAHGVENVLPLVVDLTNPSPALGWAHRERDSFLQRANADVVLALALMHHLVIGNNVPMRELARFLSSIGPRLVIEFVPKSDTQVQRMLSTRKDIFDDYTQEGFEKAFASSYAVRQKRQVTDSLRWIYSLERTAAP